MDRTCGFLLGGAAQAVTPSRSGRNPEDGVRSDNRSFTPSGRHGRTAWILAVSALCTLSSCAENGPGAGGGAGAGNPSEPKSVGVLLPLSGQNAALGSEMLAAARLAVTGSVAYAVNGQSGAGRPKVDAHDTATSGGASAAMEAALAAGDGIVLGPLTGADTATIAPLALQAGVPVLAFTSDVGQARPGLWTLGITPEQQVDRLVGAAKSEGRKQFAAFLPDNPLGHALGDALIRSCQKQGLSPAQIVYHGKDSGTIASGIASLATPQASAVSTSEPQVNAAGGVTQSAPAAEALPPDLAAALAKPSSSPTDLSPASAANASSGQGNNGAVAAAAPPPFDALLLGDTGLNLKSIIDALKANHVGSDHVRIMGPGLWGAFAGKLGAISGAWYAAPDPASRRAFQQAFTTQTHRVPKPLADLAYDAGAVANAVSTQPGGAGYPASELTRPQGFAGVDGVFALSPDGSTTRALAIFEVQPGGGSRLVSPASRRVAPTSGAS